MQAPAGRSLIGAQAGGRYIVRRILISIPVLFGITIIAFVILEPVRRSFGALISPEARGPCQWRN